MYGVGGCVRGCVCLHIVHVCIYLYTKAYNICIYIMCMVFRELLARFIWRIPFRVVLMNIKFGGLNLNAMNYCYSQ